MISRLFDTGQAAAREWLTRHHAAIGQHATVDIRRDYLDDTRFELPLRDAARTALGRARLPAVAGAAAAGVRRVAHEKTPLTPRSDSQSRACRKHPLPRNGTGGRLAESGEG
jgi:hypothetical protein